MQTSTGARLSDAARFRRQLGIIVRHLRNRKGMTQEVLGIEAHLTRVFIGQLESGSTNVSIDSLFLICQALSIPFPELVARVNELIEAEEEPRCVSNTEKNPKFEGSVRESKSPILKKAAKSSGKRGT